jgi:hypothetical protein
MVALRGSQAFDIRSMTAKLAITTVCQNLTPDDFRSAETETVLSS